MDVEDQPIAVLSCPQSVHDSVVEVVLKPLLVKLQP